ncbi:MAG: S-methyl-5'-thioadenosine phosphorylase, partial [Alcanivorax nanhaiticus]
MLAFIGGTGLTRMANLEITARHDITTRFGKPSAPVLEGELEGQKVLFLARHGDPHILLPHQVNYRANLVALKEAGASAIVAANAVGGITDQAPTGALVLPDQIIDYTYGREMTL